MFGTKFEHSLVECAMPVLAGERSSRHHAASETTQGPIDLQLMEGQIHWVTCFYMNVCCHYFSFVICVNFYQLWCSVVYCCILAILFLSGEKNLGGETYLSWRNGEPLSFASSLKLSCGVENKIILWLLLSFWSQVFVVCYTMT